MPSATSSKSKNSFDSFQDWHLLCKHKSFIFALCGWVTKGFENINHPYRISWDRWSQRYCHYWISLLCSVLQAISRTYMLHALVQTCVNIPLILAWSFCLNICLKAICTVTQVSYDGSCHHVCCLYIEKSAW